MNDPFAALFDREDERAQPPAPTSPLAPPAVPKAAAASPRGGFPAAPLKGGIPDDWDPFEHDQGPRSAPPAARGAAPVTDWPQDLPVPAAADSIDSLFGLEDRSGDPLANVFGGPAAQPNTAGHADPLRSLEEPPKVSAMPEPDHVPDMNAPWANKMAHEGSAKRVAVPKGAVLSWKAGTAGVHEAGIGARQPARSPDLDPGAPPAGADRRPAAEPPAAAAPRAGPRPMPLRQGEEGGAGKDELLQALLEGLGMPGLYGELTPELLRQLGLLLREATKGTVELLAIRAALKREIRADVTIITAAENNVLKFSPNIDGAMQHMFGPKMPGFMSPVESMRDAFQDLRAHELGVMAGMKAALAGVLLRFDPAVLESKLTRSSTLSDLIPAARKAKLWNLFETLYKQLAAEAEDDFNTLFGKAFVKAYEGYVAQLEKQHPNE